MPISTGSPKCWRAYPCSISVIASPRGLLCPSQRISSASPNLPLHPKKNPLTESRTCTRLDLTVRLVPISKCPLTPYGLQTRPPNLPPHPPAFLPHFKSLPLPCEGWRGGRASRPRSHWHSRPAGGRAVAHDEGLGPRRQRVVVAGGTGDGWSERKRRRGLMPGASLPRKAGGRRSGARGRG